MFFFGSSCCKTRKTHGLSCIQGCVRTYHASSVFFWPNEPFHMSEHDLDKVITGLWEAGGYANVSIRSTGKPSVHFVINHRSKNVLEQLREMLGSGGSIRKALYSKYTLRVPVKSFSDVMPRISGNMYDPKKLASFNITVDKANKILGTKLSPQKHIVKGVPHPSWLVAYESAGKTFEPFLDLGMYKKAQWFDEWFCGFWAGDGHVTIYSNKAQVESDTSNKTKLKWKSRVQVTQRERAPLQRIQFHYQRGLIFEVWEKTGNLKHELQFNARADVLFFLNEVISCVGHFLDDTFENHTKFATTFNKVHHPFHVVSPKTVHKKELLPWFVTGITDADGCFYVGLSKNKDTGRAKMTVAFSIGQADEMSFKQKCVSFFGVGNVYEPCFVVTGKENLRAVVKHFDKYTLQSWKNKSYVLWRQVWEAYCAGEHLTEEGFQRLEALCKEINKHGDPHAILNIEELLSKNSLEESNIPEK